VQAQLLAVEGSARIAIAATGGIAASSRSSRQVGCGMRVPCVAVSR
jgi:hypothetical protein